jgi:hypothetical protein
VLACALACSRAPSPQPPATVAPQQQAAPVLAEVDLDHLPLPMVQDRLAQAPVTVTPTDAAVHALWLAASDVLVVREAKVIGQLPAPGERPWQTADRVLAAIWPANPDCAADPQAVKLAYMGEAGLYRHPESWTVWDAQWQCCPDVDDCPEEPARACQAAARPKMQALMDVIRSQFSGLPAVSLPAGATTVARLDSPWMAQHVPAFEAAVAAMLVRAGEPTAQLQLRRYTYYAQGEPGFERAPFRPGEPAIDAALRKVLPGQLVGPLDTAWGVDVLLLVAHETARIGLKDPAIERQVRAKVCAAEAEAQRLDYRQRLLRGARIDWRRSAVAAALGQRVVERLPDRTK